MSKTQKKKLTWPKPDRYGQMVSNGTHTEFFTITNSNIREYRLDRTTSETEDHIGYFKKLSTAKQVANLIYNG